MAVSALMKRRNVLPRSGTGKADPCGRHVGQDSMQAARGQTGDRQRELPLRRVWSVHSIVGLTRSGSSSGPVVIGACVWGARSSSICRRRGLLCFTVLLRSRAQCVSNACATSLLEKRLPGHRPNQAVQISRLLPADACSAAQTCTKHHSSKILQCGHSPISAYRLSPVSSRPTAHMTPTLKTAMRRTTTVRPQLQDNTTT